jgi:hypothetical protein
MIAMAPMRTETYGPNVVEYFNMDQGSLDWHKAHIGIATASSFAAILTKSKKPGEVSATRQTYMLKKLGERLTGEAAESFETAHTQRGHAMEPEARKWYQMIEDLPVTFCGFARATTPFGVVGCSPDGLVGDHGLLEIKTRLPHLQLAMLLENDVPKEHVAQVQGQLWVCNRQWVDYCSYWPGLPTFRRRVFRDEGFIAELKVAVESFCADIDTTEKRIRAYGN